MDEITNIGQLFRAISDTLTAGYFVDVVTSPRTERTRDFLVIAVDTNDPNPTVAGEWWFDGDDHVMQIL